MPTFVSPILFVFIIYGAQIIIGQRQCPRLQKPWNGVIVGDTCDRHVGSQCEFDCRTPYILVGSRVRTCREDGTWSGRTAACDLDGCEDCAGCSDCGRDSTCPSLFEPEGGTTRGQCRPGIVGQVCTFHCNAGYELDGPSSITCRNNNQWSSAQPVCRRKSSALCENFDILNGDASCLIQGTSITICTMACDEGYMLVGSSVITCSPSGDWNAPFPTCRRGSPDVTNICPTLVAPEGGRLVGSCVAANTGDTCQLVCISGYRPTDTRILVCQMNGKWSNSLPRCVSSGCPGIQVPNAVTTGTCNPGAQGQSCTIRCQPGHVLVGSGTLVCHSNGQWSDIIPTCTVRSCPALRPPMSGGTSGTCSPGVVGQMCNFYCNTGYVLVGQADLMCGSDGQWSINPPSCIAETKCPALQPPTNGAQSGSCTRALVGQSCSFTCQAGFVLNGAQTLHCRNGGQWSGAPPTCGRSSPIISCSSLSSPANGFSVGSCNPGHPGETCIFGCDEGYVLRGSQTLTCQVDGRWSAAAPRCERAGGTGSCPILTPPPQGNFEECDNRPGGRCIVVCAAGYIRTGSRVRTCLESGTWSGYSPTCSRKVRYTTTYSYKVVPLWSLVFG